VRGLSPPPAAKVKKRAMQIKEKTARKRINKDTIILHKEGFSRDFIMYLPFVFVNILKIK